MTVTLETLRADFEAAIADAKSNLIPLFNGATDHQADMALEAGYRLDPWPLEWIDYMRTGAIYAVARDYGLEAAMLFKLSDGAIDPRKEEQS